MQLILKVMFILLSALLEVLWLISYPFLYFILGKRNGRERLGIGYPQEQYDVLIHAASVGEINGIKPLLMKLIELHPNYKILLTVNTTTGRNVGSKLHTNINCIISPLDIIHLRIRQIKQTRPQLILIAETEIWPSQLYSAKLYQIPVVFINARISEKSVNRYLQVKPLLDWLCSSVKLICTQSDKDTRRFEALFYKKQLVGQSPTADREIMLEQDQHPALQQQSVKIVTCGNLKYAVQLPKYDRGERRKAWGYADTDIIIVIGSSRPGEETVVLRCFDSLITKYPKLKLIIAPRHLNRLDEIRNLVKDREVSYFTLGEKAKSIHIIDELGHLLPAYAMSDIAIIGGSYFPFGGHNPLEAAFYGKVIMMGEYHQSCVDSVKSLLAEQAIIIDNKDTLCQDLDKVIENPEKYRSYGERARTVMTQNSHSLDKHIEVIKPYLR